MTDCKSQKAPGEFSPTRIPLNPPQKRDPQHPIIVAYSLASEELTFLARVSCYLAIAREHGDHHSHR